MRALTDALEGGRGGKGEVERHAFEVADTGENTEERVGRVLRRDTAGMVRRKAAGLEEGVLGRVGGTMNSKRLDNEFLCDLARDAVVGAS
jgi:urocanate hydratase